MNVFIKSLALLAILSIPSVLLAQPNSGLTPSTSLKPFKEINKSELTLLPQPAIGNSREVSFMKHLPLSRQGEKIKFLTDDGQTDPTYYYNMPVVKPGRTSEILIVKLDPHSPYSFNMPVRKIDIVKP